MNKTPEELLASVEPWIAAKASLYAKWFPKVEFDDFAQIARIAAWGQIDKFDQSRGVPFIGFARFRMLREMRRFGILSSRATRIPQGARSSAVCFLSLEYDVISEEIPAVDPVGECCDDARFAVAALDRLTNRQKSIITRRFLDGMTQDEISESDGVTTQGISQIELKALSRLRKMLRESAISNRSKL